MKMLNILDHKLLLSRWSKSKSVLTMVKKRPEAPTACLYAGNWFRHVGGLAHLDPEPEKTQFWAKVFTFGQTSLKQPKVVKLRNQNFSPCSDPRNENGAASTNFCPSKQAQLSRLESFQSVRQSMGS